MGFLNKTEANSDPIVVLSSRIKYYPIVQLISVSGSIAYLTLYGFSPHTYGDTESMNQKVMLFFYALTYPTAGLGYFIVFLMYQPNAYKHLRRHFCRCCNDDITMLYDQIVSPEDTGHGDAERYREPILSNTSTTSDTDHGTGTLFSTTDTNEKCEYSEALRLEDMDEEQLMREIESKYIGDLAQHVIVMGGGDGEEYPSIYSSQSDFCIRRD